MRLKFPDEASPPGDALPEFGSPPVVETSIGFQFEGLVGFKGLHAATFWSRIRDEFPILEEHPPLDPVFETFGPRSNRLETPEIRFVTGPMQPRLFFVSADGSELVQLQSDRLFFNWRRQPSAVQYPRYGHVRDRLSDMIKVLSEWAAEEGLGSPKPTQAEAIYVNAIPLKKPDGSECGLSFYFQWLEGLMGTTEDGIFRFRRRLENERGEPVARLNFQLGYGTDEESSRQVTLNLHVRGQPPAPTFDDCLAMIDAEREIIVRTFTQITSAEAHKVWERQQ